MEGQRGGCHTSGGDGAGAGVHGKPAADNPFLSPLPLGGLAPRSCPQVSGHEGKDIIITAVDARR